MYLIPFPLFNFREFVIIEVIAWVHIDDLSLCGSSKNFDDLY